MGGFGGGGLSLREATGKVKRGNVRKNKTGEVSFRGIILVRHSWSSDLVGSRPRRRREPWRGTRRGRRTSSGG